MNFKVNSDNKFERDLFITIEKGNVIKEEEVQNY